MTDRIDCKIAVIGGGPAGYVAAIRAAQLGAKVVLIEEKELGGVCLNIGCIPTKALLKTAETASGIRKSKEFGIEASISNINWNSAVNRKNRVVKNLNTGVEQLLLSNGVTIIKGRGTVMSDRKILVNTDEKSVEVNCEKIILATGASPYLPPIKGINSEGVITSNEALSLELLPQSLIIIGAGVIGLEFATMFAALGVKTSVLELQERILPGMDREVAEELLKLMKRQGISFKLSASVNEIKNSEVGLEVSYTNDEKSYTLSAEKVLVAVGRKLNSDIFQNLLLHIEKGAVIVDDSMETNIKGVYAAGDLVGGQLLAHLSFLEGKTAAENALGIRSRVNYRDIHPHPTLNEAIWEACGDILGRAIHKIN